MLSYTFVDAFTHAPRREAIARLKKAIAAVDGVIVDFAFFANGAIRLSVELEAGLVGSLREALEACGVHLFEKSMKVDGSSTRPVLAMLHVAFVVEEADEAEMEMRNGALGFRQERRS